MTPQQANDIADKLVGNYPRMTDQQMLQAAQKVEKFNYDCAVRAVNKMVETIEEFSLPKFLMMVRTEKPREASENARFPSYIETLREDVSRRFPGKRVAIKQMTDAEFMLRVGRAWWLDCSDPRQASDPEGERATGWPGRIIAIKHSMRRELVASVGEQNADAYAAACVGTELDFTHAIDSIRPIPNFD